MLSGPGSSSISLDEIWPGAKVGWESWLSVEQAPFHEAIKQEDATNDFLIYLSILLDTTSLNDSDDDSDTDLENSSVLSSPRPKCLPQTKTYFYAGGRLYYYDEDQDVYPYKSVEPVQKQPAPFSIDRFNLSENLGPDFFIDGVPYYFDINGTLTCQPKEGAEYQKVHTWPDVPPSFEDAPGATPIPNTTEGASELNSEIPKVPPECEVPAVLSVSKLIKDKAVETKHEVGTPDANSLGRSLSRAMPISPASSTQSLITPLDNPIPSEELEPLIQSSLAQEIQHQVEVEPEAPQPTNIEGRRCPQCKKVLSRRCNLKSHLNTHSGEKPHLCTICGQGFAKKSNMTRHLKTHDTSKVKKHRTKLARSPTTMNKSNPYHVRFRVATS